jgi:hypothetical protein
MQLRFVPSESTDFYSDKHTVFRVVQLYRNNECTNPEMICTRVCEYNSNRISSGTILLVLPDSHPKVAPK